MKKKTFWISPLLLFLTAVIWGIAFVAQSVGMDYVGGFTFNCTRSLLGSVVLIPCIVLLERMKHRPGESSHLAQGDAAKAGDIPQRLNGQKRTAGRCCLAEHAAASLCL